MKNDFKKNIVFSYKDLLLSILVLSITFGICYLIQVFIEYSESYSSILFMLSIFLISRFTKGYLFGMISSILASFIVNYAFTYPYFKLSFSIPGYIITFFIMLIVAFLTSILTTRLQEEERIKIEAEKEKIRSSILQSLSHDLRTPLTCIIGISEDLKK